MIRHRFLFLLTLVSCNDSTGGHLISVPFSAGGVARDLTQPFTFTNDSGWTITLQEAKVVLGPFYFNIQPPNPDAFRSGVVIMQATEQVVIDALDPDLYPVTGGADGETGHAISTEIDFFTTTYQYNQTLAVPPPLLGLDSEGSTVSGTAYVSGQASKGATNIAFAGRIVVDDNALTASIPIEAAACVPGALTDLNFTATTTALSLRVDPSRWFDDQPDFCQLVPPEPGAVCAADPIQVYGWTSDKRNPTSGFNAALLVGLKSASGTYGFSLEQK